VGDKREILLSLHRLFLPLLSESGQETA
jgi:hypothetical protein